MAPIPASPGGTTITVRPIEPEELDWIPLRCWPDRKALDRLFTEQGTIGMAAWEGDRCVGQLHCYRVVLPAGRNEHWPEWNNWWSTQRWSEAAGRYVPELTGPAWCHACFHVGRTLRSSREEARQLVFRFAQKSDWDTTRTLRELNQLPGVCFSKEAVESIIEELRSSGRTIFNTIEPQYHGRGIGTALCEASVRWARDHDTVAVLAPGAPDALFAPAVWAGGLPWTTYARLGFETVYIGTGGELPEWAQGNSPPEVMAEVEAALAGGRSVESLRERLMVLDLRHRVDVRSVGSD